MSYRRPSHGTVDYEKLPSGVRARLGRRLRAAGLSGVSAEQALAGQAVTSGPDRERLAELLVWLLGKPSGARLEVFNWPGEYAQRFDGVD